MQGQITEHFTYGELTHTDSNLPNIPDDEQLVNLKRLAVTILEPARFLVGALHVNSGFRSKAVNEALRNHSNTSQHMDGLAADVRPLITPLERSFQMLRVSNIPYDQIIVEPGWIHISAAPLHRLPRRQALRAHLENGRMVYDPA